MTKAPEVQHVAVTLSDGSLTILQFVTKSYFAHDQVEFEREASQENVYAEIVKAGLDATNFRPIDKSEIPTDRTFRNAWRDNGDSISVDKTKARDIHMATIRRKRDEKLARLDILHSRALANPSLGPSAPDIEKQRQALRDIPHTFDLTHATTPEELKKLWPKELE